MFKNELIATLKQTAVIMSFMLLIPIIHRVNEMRLSGGTSSLNTYMMNGSFLAFAVLIAGLAYKMFSSEDSDNALEYLKTLPISKWELLRTKVLPRLVILLVSALVIITLSTSSESSLTFDLFFLVIAPILLSILTALMLGFFLGLSDRKNPILIGSMTLLTLYPLLGSVLAFNIHRGIVQHTQTDIPIYWAAPGHFLIISAPILISLYLLLPIYKSWDCTSGKVRSQVILKRLAVPSILIVLLWAELLKG